MKKLLAGIASLALSACIFAGCGGGTISLEKTSTDGLNDTYTLTTDGGSATFTVTNGKDGVLSVSDAYETYKSIYGDISYDEFLKKYFTSETGNTQKAVNDALLSSLKVACEFSVYSLSGGGFFGRPNYTLTPSVQQGSAVIYRIDGEYAYAVTNYHVIYNGNAEGNKESEKIYVYLYGSEQTPYLDSSTSKYVYGDMAIPCEYIGGDINYDVALLKISLSSLQSINPSVRAAHTQNSFSVGDVVFTVGNTEGLGISVNSGIVSVDSEYITLKIDGTERSYRSIRMDAVIHEGNSGGGLFNSAGKLIGINNAGSTNTVSMNYAIPASIVCGVADNILDNYNGSAVSGVKKFTLGVTVSGTSSRFVYDSATGSGRIVEDVTVTAVEADCAARAMGLAEGDIITGVRIGETEYKINRFFEIGDLLLTVRAGDGVTISYKRGGQEGISSPYSVTAESFA